MKTMIILAMTAFFLFNSTTWAQRASRSGAEAMQEAILELRDAEAEIIKLVPESAGDSRPTGLLHPFFDVTGGTLKLSDLKTWAKVLKGTIEGFTKGVPPMSYEVTAIKILREYELQSGLDPVIVLQNFCDTRTQRLFKDELMEIKCKDVCLPGQ